MKEKNYKDLKQRTKRFGLGMVQFTSAPTYVGDYNPVAADVSPRKLE